MKQMSEMQVEVNHQQQQIQIPNSSIRQETRILRIFADNYDKKSVFIFWLVFFAILLTMFLLTLALPQTFISFQNLSMTQGTNLQNCSNPIGFDVNQYLSCGTISNSTPIVGLFLKDLDPKYQFGLVYINFMLKNNGDSQLNFQQKVNITFYSLNEQQKSGVAYYKKDSVIAKSQIDFKIVSQQATRFYMSDGYTIGGYYTFFGYMKYITYQNYFISFQFEQWPIYNVNHAYLDITLVNPQFTIFTIVLRYVFFAITLATGILFYLRFRIIPDQLKTIQQRLVCLLSILTVFFNDPFYPITILAPNGFTSFTSVAFICNLVAYLIIFWIIFIQRILHQNGQKHENVLTWKKGVYFLLLYIIILVMNCLMAFLRLSDEPIIQSEHFTNGSIAVFQILAIIFFAFGFVYIIVQYVRTCQNFMQKLWRNQLFLIMSAFFIFVLGIITISNGFGVFQFAGNRVLLLFTTMNMYTVYLQYMYSITNEQLAQMLRDNYLQNSMGYQVATGISDFGMQSVKLDLDAQQISMKNMNMNMNKNKNNGYILQEKKQLDDQSEGNMNMNKNGKNKFKKNEWEQQQEQKDQKEPHKMKYQNMFQIED